MHDQAENLRNKIRKKSYEGNTRTISVVSGKGGVGKSNFALNFALALVRDEKKVLIIDLDIGMGNIDILLGKHSTRSINELFEGKATMAELVEEGPENLQYISGGSGLGDLLDLDEQKQNKFYNEFKDLSRNYDFVIFDMGAGATKESISFILASDDCILISTPEPTALTDAYGMIKHIVNNYGNMPINIVINRSISDKIGTKALNGLQEVAKQFLGRELFALGVIPEDSTVQKAVMKQMPYLIYKENAAVSSAVIKIAAAFLGNPSVGSGSFLSKLKQLVKQRGGGYGNQSGRN